MTRARSPDALLAAEFVEQLQHRFVDGLEACSRAAGVDQPFESVEWLRDGGRHGGGRRLGTGETALLDRASVNVSQVHYDDEPSRKLGSATALSTIVHPRNPHAPSVHMHISWTEMRDGRGTWRIMADLNPSLEATGPKEAFEAALRQAAPAQYDAASREGERYFFIPALGRHRGVSHFYREGYSSGDRVADLALARSVGLSIIDCYLKILAAARDADASDEDRARQLAYHTLYLFQVLTLDRGTSSGLLVHDQNDVGILGSLPSHVDRGLLGSWVTLLPRPQDALLTAILDALPHETPSPVTIAAKRALAQAVRVHYQKHPEALALQASGDTLPPTVDNHR
jgi:coproporphyrinogen III oxidase